jgi:micrococcal nuclease
MIRLLLSILLLGAIAVATPRAVRGQNPDDACVVAHVLDGDTFNCQDGRKVRLLLVDTPEAGRFGNVARRALATLIPVGTEVAIEVDSIPRDETGRTLGYVYMADGRMVNEVLVREGFGFFKPSRPNDRYAEKLRAAEDLAREETRGVWSQ